MNIKELDKFKHISLFFVDTLPLEKMECDIQTSKDPLIKALYNNLIDGTHLVDKHRYREIYHKFGIVWIYTLFDPCYSDFIRWMINEIEGADLQLKNPKNWRVNTA